MMRGFRWVLVIAASAFGCGDDTPAATTPGVTLTPMAPPQLAPPPPLPSIVPVVPTPVQAAGSTATPAEAQARIDAWLAGSLRGHDNNMARMRAVRIRRLGGEPAQYTASIANQFRWTCGLDFGADGSPAMLRGCRSAEAGWFATPDEIPLTCELRDADEICAGRYTLGARGGMRMPARFQIIRPL